VTIMSRRRIIIGTRGSALALCQTEWVISRLQAVCPAIATEKRIIRTTGDLARENAKGKDVGKGVFVKEIEEALLRGEIDLAVHSLKDLPTELPEGLCIGAVPERADPRDALVSNYSGLAQLPYGARLGTTSLRRRAQLAGFRRDFQFFDLKGNLDTRLRKLDEGRFDAVVLGCAGLERMGWASRITERIPLEVCMPAAGQGALALEVRADDKATLEQVRLVEDKEARCAVDAERSMLRTLGGGCAVPIGACGFVKEGKLWLLGVVASVDGEVIVRREICGSPDRPEEVGRELANELSDAGAKDILRWNCGST